MGQTITTTNIGIQERSSLKRLASRHGLKQVEFVNYAIEYFKKTGINPSEPIFSPREEIAKLTKRVDQVIQFIANNEKNKLNPLLDELIIISKKIDEQLGNQAKLSDFKELTSYLNNVFSFMVKSQKAMLKSMQEKDEAEGKSAFKISELEQQLVIVTNMLIVMYRSMENKSAMSSGFKSEDVERFNHLISRKNAIH